MVEKRYFKLDKLVRDLVPERQRARGISVFEPSIRAKHEFIKQLQNKLLEEAKEVIDATTSDAVREEVADLLEVIYTLMQEYNVSIEEIEAARLAKKAQRGGFADRIYVSYVEMQGDNSSIHYFLGAPEKYPEISKEATVDKH